MGSPYQDLMSAQRSTPGTHIGDQGLSPPYSNQSPPHSVQSNIALSPQGYVGKLSNSIVHSVVNFRCISDGKKFIVFQFKVHHRQQNQDLVCPHRLLTYKQCDMRPIKNMDKVIWRLRIRHNK